jgi:inner membrane protein
MRRPSYLIKILVVVSVCLVLLVPLLLLQGVVTERAQRRERTESEIFQSWGGRQTLAGPVLTVPYVSRSVDANGKRVETVTAAHFLPGALTIHTDLQPQTRSRGMYQVTVYDARLSISGTFDAPDFSGLRVGTSDILWDQAFLSLELQDLRSLQEKILLSWGSARIAMRSGHGSLGIFPGEIRANLPMSPGARAGTLPFSFDLALRGGGSISFLPLGDETRVRVRSSWPSPSFTGAFLPANRSLRADGFDADWRVVSTARAWPQRWLDSDGRETSLMDTAFGVSLMSPVQTYLEVTRALKYGLLFLVLPFCTLFLFEVLARRRIHPVQYLLIGLADCVFYLLLLALAEHTGFVPAYLAAAAACTGLVTLYTVAVVRGTAGIAMLPVLGACYGFLGLVLSSEDNALLLGATGLFLLLGAAMFLTRKVDWYRKERSEEHGQGGTARADR